MITRKHEKKGFRPRLLKKPKLIFKWSIKLSKYAQ